MVANFCPIAAGSPRKSASRVYLQTALSVIVLVAISRPINSGLAMQVGLALITHAHQLDFPALIQVVKEVVELNAIAARTAPRQSAPDAAW